MQNTLKIIGLLFVLILLSACGEENKTPVSVPETTQLPVEKTVLIDIVDYVDFDDNGDDFYLTTNKNGTKKSFVYNKEDEKIHSYTKDDILEITYAMDSVTMAGDEEMVKVLAVAMTVKKIGEKPKKEEVEIRLPEIKIDETYILNLVNDNVKMKRSSVKKFHIKLGDQFTYYKVDNFLENNYVLLIAYYESETTAYLTSTNTDKPLAVFYTNEEGCWQTESTIKDAIIDIDEYNCGRETENIKSKFKALPSGKIKALRIQ